MPIALAVPMPRGCALQGGQCPADDTRQNEIYPGDCNGNQMQYELEFYDAPISGNQQLEDTGESSLQDVACIDGHDVCSNKCDYLQTEIIRPPIPSASVDIVDQNYPDSDGYISWAEYSEEVYAQDQCSPEVQNCWTDVTEQFLSSESNEYYWSCNYELEQRQPPRRMRLAREKGAY